MINTPCELVKCRQQLNINRHTSIREVASGIVKADGLLGLYRGFFVTFNRDFLSYGLYFYVFFKLKDYWEERKTLTHFKLMLAGGITGKYLTFIL